VSFPYWIHANTEVKPSAIHGLGRFSTSKISASTIVMVVGGRIIEIEKERWSTGIPVADGLVIQAHDDFSRNGVINHSCDPNLEIIGDICFYSMRDIQPGEELTVDYGSFLYSASGPRDFIEACGCGSPRCRGQIHSEDWRQRIEQGLSVSSFLKRHARHSL